MNTLELARVTAPQFGSAGATFYFHDDTVATGKEHGLDGFRFYILGRGGVLGDVESSVVASAFGYFNPALIHKMWTTAQTKMAPRDAGRLYIECCAALGRKQLADVEGLEAFCAAAEKVVAAVDVSGLSLFAAVAAEPAPEDLLAKTAHLVMVLRELRGSVHLAAIVGGGLSPIKAHAIRRPDDAFGWDPMPEVSEGDRALLDAIDIRTDEIMAAHYSVLDEVEIAALAVAAEAIAAI
jgi:hypothetical protein